MFRSCATTFTKLTDHDAYNNLDEQLKKDAAALDEAYDENGLFKDVETVNDLAGKLMPCNLIYCACPDKMFTYAAIVSEKELRQVCRAFRNTIFAFEDKAERIMNKCEQINTKESLWEGQYWQHWFDYIEMVDYWLLKHATLADVLQIRQIFIDYAGDRLNEDDWSKEHEIC